jgi:predicted ATPase
LGLKLEPGLAPGQIAIHLGASTHLLILDNCEHQIAAVSGLSEVILRAAPAVHILATSQARLGLLGENVYRLAPLPSPADVTLYGVEQSPAAALFAARVADTAPGFELTNANAAAVCDICARLDGIPLALELAAARVSLLGVEGVRARLDHRLKLLTKSQRGAPARHLTLRTALDWSYDLLTPGEQFVFRCLSVFRGGFCGADVQAVAVSDAVDPWTALDALGALLDRALVARKPGGDANSEPRLLLLETMAEFAGEKLAEAGEAADAYARHAHLMRARLQEAQDAEWTPHASALVSRAVQDIANLRAALTWAAGPDGEAALLIALAGAGSVVWTQAGAETEALAWCEVALRAVTPTTRPALEAELLTAFAKLGQQTDAAREIAALERAVDLFAAAGDRQGQYIALGALAKKQVWRRDEDAAARTIAAAEAVFDPHWPAAIRTNVLQAKTYLFEIQGRPEAGEPLMIELLAIMRALGDPLKIDLAMIELAESYMVQGKNLAEAAALRQAVFDRSDDKSPNIYNLANLFAVYSQMDCLDEALACARRAIDGLKRTKKLATFLDHFALLACKRGRLQAGAHLVGLSDRLLNDSGFDREMSEVRARAQAEALLRTAMPQERLVHLYAEGGGMGMAEAVNAATAP